MFSALVSRRFVPIYQRNLLVWRKLALASVVGNIAEPLITLIAFGYGLGRLLPEVNGVSYILFLAAGSVCMGTAMATSFESLYSAFARMQVQRTWESLLNAPLELDDVVIAEWLWAASKGALSGFSILAVVYLLGVSREPTLLLVLPVVMLTGLCFSAIGLCFTALARGYDFFTFYFTLAMVFLSGVYYPVEQLPVWLAGPAGWLPLALAVELARPLVLGEWPSQVLVKMVALMLYTLVALYLARALIVRRFRS
jgi:lipooligosaccharide transport system permease protein